MAMASARTRSLSTRVVTCRKTSAIADGGNVKFAPGAPTLWGLVGAGATVGAGAVVTRSGAAGAATGGGEGGAFGFLAAQAGAASAADTMTNA